MGTMKASGALLVMAVALVPSAVRAQQAYNGTKPMLCAMSHVVECDGMGLCERRTPESKDLPRFVRVDTTKRALSATEGPRSAEIKSISRTDGRLILQGGEMGRGWSAAIAEDTGVMAVAIVDHDATFSVFGACTIP
jgi:hypothetical protein